MEKLYTRGGCGGRNSPALIAIRALVEIYLFIFAGGSRVCLTGFFMPTRLERGATKVANSTSSNVSPLLLFYFFELKCVCSNIFWFVV